MRRNWSIKNIDEFDIEETRNDNITQNTYNEVYDFIDVDKTIKEEIYMSKFDLSDSEDVISEKNNTLNSGFPMICDNEENFNFDNVVQKISQMSIPETMNTASKYAELDSNFPVERKYKFKNRRKIITPLPK